MNPIISKNQHADIEALIYSGKLYDAFQALKTLLKNFDSNNEIKQLTVLEETYRYLLQYMAEGWADEQREYNLNSIKASLLKINDAAFRELKAKDSSQLYYSSLRFERIRNENLSSHLEQIYKTFNALDANDGIDYITKRKEYEEAVSALFIYVWTMFNASKEEYERIKDEIISGGLPDEVKSQIISALLLGNIQFFDANALISLIDIYEADINDKISSRSLVSIFLILYINFQRVVFEDNIKSRLLLWQDSILNFTRLKEVIINVIRTKETQRISEKVQEEVMPELLKLRPDILEKLKGFNKSASDASESNPDWEEMIEKTGLADKLRELTEIQMEGGDFMMSAFSNLKNFSFFKNISNWFLPFSFNNSHILSSSPEFVDSFKELFKIEGVICDSDKYSFALSLAGMPDFQKKMLSERMSEQMNQLKEAMEDNHKSVTYKGFNKETTLYIRDLYRFFKLFPKRNEFPDPFANISSFINLSVLSEYVRNEEILALTGEFFFKHGYYNDALGIFESLDKIKAADPVLWEKIGFCLENINKPEEALKWYRKAELLNPDSKWLLRRIAILLKSKGDFSESFEYFLRLKELKPDDVNILFNLGFCKLQIKKYSEALPFFYHAEYLAPERKEIMRAIGWTELLNSNFEKSRQYYDRILNEGEVKAEDYLNSGHLHYLSGDIKKAVIDYGKSLSLEAGNTSRFLDLIEADIPMLEPLGVKKEDLNLIIEKLKYK